MVSVEGCQLLSIPVRRGNYASWPSCARAVIVVLPRERVYWALFVVGVVTLITGVHGHPGHFTNSNALVARTPIRPLRPTVGA
jgi:hypothetical protein